MAGSPLPNFSHSFISDLRPLSPSVDIVSGKIVDCSRSVRGKRPDIAALAKELVEQPNIFFARCIDTYSGIMALGASVAKAFEKFDEVGRMKPSSYYDRIVDMMEELVRFTVLLRPHAAQLVDRYSERKDAGVSIDQTSDLSSIATVPQGGSWGDGS